MPSPIAHAAMGITIYEVTRQRYPQLEQYKIGPVPVLQPMVIGFSLLPDADFIAAMFFGNAPMFHNNTSHSYFAGMIVAAVVGAVAWILARLPQRRAALPPPRASFALTLIAYSLHVAMDFFTVGRGVKVLWPITSERLVPSFTLFYGVHWGDGLAAWEHHLITISSELLFVVLLFILLQSVTIAPVRRVPRRIKESR